MESALLQVKEYLRSQYEALYQRPGWEFADASGIERPCPMWVWQGPDLNSVRFQESATGAAILDPDIGLCLYVQVYDSQIPIRQQIIRALQVRSNLLPRQRIADSKADKLGSWQVTLHWLVEESQFPSWIAEAAEMRDQTAHFEEVPADAIVRKGNTWAEAIRHHAMPRLLFKTRSVLKMQSRSDVEQWQSADRLVIAALDNFPSVFADPVSRQCATEVYENLHRNVGNVVADIPAASTPEDLLSLSIQNFRNIDELKIQFRSSHSDAEAVVIHGPNGSGKSSVYEAMCIAVSKASHRYLGYLNDKHRSGFGRSDTYATEYLRNLASEMEDAKLALNDEELRPVILAPADEVSARVRNLQGTFLSQDHSQFFIRMSASELGGEIASGLSSVASELVAYVEDNLGSALNQQKSFNSRWGLRANITRKETVISQIATRMLSTSLPNLAELIAWVGADAVGNSSLTNQCRALKDRFAAWQDRSQNVVNFIAKDLGRTGGQELLRDYISSLNDSIEAMHHLFAQIVERMSGWVDGDDKLLSMWGEWLERRAPESTSSSEEIASLRTQERSANDTLSRITEDGRLISDRMKHLESVKPFISQWSSHQDEICPTCGSDVSEMGGISSHITALFASLENDRESSRAEYSRAREEVRSVQSRLADLGVAPPPVSAEDQRRLSNCVSWLLQRETSLEGILEEAGARSALLSTVRHVTRRPNLPPLKDGVEDWSAEFIGKIASISDEHDKVSRLPEAWKEVQKNLVQVLAEVTSKHLPETIQALWQEIAKNIMPAAWQQPGDIEFTTRARQRQVGPEASITIKSDKRTVLADHILNGAQIHNLGLAWFFTKYLLFGRFQHRFIVLDDPSDPMDQATYRDFCRFLETILRLHRVEGVPLTLTLLLPQDERALDAARAMGAVLYLLRWNRHTKALDRALRVYGEQIASPLPLVVLEAG